MKRFIYIVIFFFVSFLGVSFTTLATTADSVRQQIESTNKQIAQLDAEIKQYQDQISKTNEQSNTLANLIKELTLTRDKLLKEKTQTEKKITATNLVIGVLSDNIAVQEQSLEKSKESLLKMIRDVYQRDQSTILERLISQENFSEASREYNNILSVNEQIRKHMIDVSQMVEDLNASKSKKVTEQQNLTTLKKTLIQKQLAVEVTKQEKNTLLTETKNQESNYKKLLVDRQKKRDAFEKQLQDYEFQLKFILNSNLLPTEGSGVLSWPLDSVYVTQLFGKTVAAKRLYVSGSHSGVDFRASIGTPVKSMGTGTVIGTGNTDDYCKGASFGKWVFIRYNNGLSSTFGHLSVISSSAGQKVQAGDVVALSGNTGHSTAPHLHVTVYASQGSDVKTVPSLSCNGKIFIMPIAPSKAYLDPLLYLPKLSGSQIKNDTARD